MASLPGEMTTSAILTATVIARFQEPAHLKMIRNVSIT